MVVIRGVEDPRLDEVSRHFSERSHGLCAQGTASMIFSRAARLPPTGRPVVHSATVEKGNRLACWLWGKGYRDVDPIPFGCTEPDELARRFDVLLQYVKRVCALEGSLCTAELIPALYGLEGQRVELTFHDGRCIRCLIGQRLDGAMVVHIARQDENDPGEVLTFGEFRVVQVISP